MVCSDPKGRLLKEQVVDSQGKGSEMNKFGAKEELSM